MILKNSKCDLHEVEYGAGWKGYECYACEDLHPHITPCYKVKCCLTRFSNTLWKLYLWRLRDTTFDQHAIIYKMLVEGEYD